MELLLAFGVTNLASLEQLRNISSVEAILASKFLRSSSVIFAQPENIELISSTFDVLKLLRSSRVRLSQPLNIPSISVTSEVENPVRFNSVRALQP